MSEDSKIEIKIQSTYDGTGATQAQKSLTTLTQQAGTTLGTQIPQATQKTRAGLKDIAKMAAKAQTALAKIRNGLGWIGILYTAYEAIKKFYTYLTAKAQTVITAGQNIATAWKAAAQATTLKEKDTQAEAALQRQLALHQQILAAKRETASFEAQLRETTARTNGNLREARRAVLDGNLARGEITPADHRTATLTHPDTPANTSCSRRKTPSLIPKPPKQSEES